MGAFQALLRGVATAVLAVAWLAAPHPAGAAGCEDAGAARVEIARVTDDLDVVLKDDRTVRLAGVKALSTASGAQLAGWVTQAAAAAPGAVTLRLLSPVADRWGRVAGDAFVGGRHMQSMLAEKGLAVARPDDLRGPCWESVKAAEAKARRDNAGLWADAASILPASDGPKILERDGVFTLASGRVVHVSRGKDRRRSYVDFGRRGDNALFLTIDVKALTRMENLGFKLEQLNGRKLLVRGVVAGGRAPHMVIDDIDAIEFWD